MPVAAATIPIDKPVILLSSSSVEEVPAVTVVLVVVNSKSDGLGCLKTVHVLEPRVKSQLISSLSLVVIACILLLTPVFV